METVIVSRCPSCQIPMNLCGVDTLVLDICNGCHGIWFDTQELASRPPLPGLSKLPELFERDRGSGHGRPCCPACVTQLLSLVRVDGISVMICFDCRGCFIPGYQVKVFEEQAATSTDEETADTSDPTPIARLALQTLAASLF